jgi:hypothetical protein
MTNMKLLKKTKTYLGRWKQQSDNYFNETVEKDTCPKRAWKLSKTKFKKKYHFHKAVMLKDLLYNFPSSNLTNFVKSSFFYHSGFICLVFFSW